MACVFDIEGELDFAPFVHHTPLDPLDALVCDLIYQESREEPPSDKDNHHTPTSSHSPTVYRQPQTMKPDATFSSSYTTSRVQPHCGPQEQPPVGPLPSFDEYGDNVPDELYGLFDFILFDDEPASPSVPNKVTSTGDRLAEPPLTLAARDLNTQNFVPPVSQQELASGSIRQQRGKSRDGNCLAAGTENRPAPVSSRRQQPAPSLYRHEEQVHRHSHSTLPAFPASVPAPAFSFEETFAAIPDPLCVPPDWTYGPMPTLPRDEPIASPVPEVSSAIDRRSRTKPKLSASTHITRQPVPLQANAGPSRVDGSNDPARASESSTTPLYFNFHQSQPIPQLQGQGAHNQADVDSTTDSLNVPPPSAMPTLHPSASMSKSKSVTEYIKGFTPVVTDTGDRKYQCTNCGALVTKSTTYAHRSKRCVVHKILWSCVRCGWIFTRQDAAKRHDDSATERCKDNQKVNVKGNRPKNVSEGMQTARAEGFHIKPYVPEPSSSS